MVFVVRKDLNMRKGKIAAQSCHSALSFLTRNGHWEGNTFISKPPNAQEVKEWMESSYKKIVVSVKSELELMEIHNKAQEAGLESHLIIDSGLTEFHGIPTPTVVAIGPNYSEKIDPITGHLELM